MGKDNLSGYWWSSLEGTTLSKVFSDIGSIWTQKKIVLFSSAPQIVPDSPIGIDHADNWVISIGFYASHYLIERNKEKDIHYYRCLQTFVKSTGELYRKKKFANYVNGDFMLHLTAEEISGLRLVIATS